jgi:hypothetical protein
MNSHGAGLTFGPMFSVAGFLPIGVNGLKAVVERLVFANRLLRESERWGVAHRGISRKESIMSKKHWVLAMALGVGLANYGNAIRAEDPKDAKGKDQAAAATVDKKQTDPVDTKPEEKVTLDQLPAAVKATLLEESKGGPLDDIVKDWEEEEDIRGYATAANIHGKFYNIFIDEDGTLAVKELNEDRIAPESIPAAALAGLNREAKGAKIERAFKDITNGRVGYEANFTIDGKECIIEVAQDGTLLSKSVETSKNSFTDVVSEKVKPTPATQAKGKDKDQAPAATDDEEPGPPDDSKVVKVPLDKLPAAVQTTLVEESKGGPSDEVLKTDEDVYWTAANIGGKFYNLVIEKDGTLFSKDVDHKRVALETIPAAALATLTNAAEGEKIVHVHLNEKRTKDGKAIYNAFLMLGGKEVQIGAAEDGTFLNKEVNEEANRHLMR